MKLWVHRIKNEDGTYGFLPNEEFSKIFKGGRYRGKNDGWLPYKVIIPEDMHPVINEDRSIAIDIPRGYGRTLLTDVLTAGDDGRPVLRFDKGFAEPIIYELEEVDY